jgi:thymidylate kinase
MSLIVIEGPDGAGKTTLIEQLRANSTRYFAILRASGPPVDKDGRPSAGVEFMTAAKIFADEFEPFSVICDRFHTISENVYGPLFSRRSSPEPIALIAHNLRAVNFLIYCRPPVSVILENIKSNEQMEGVNEKTLDIITTYDRLMAELSNERQIYRYDYTVKGALYELRNAIPPE